MNFILVFDRMLSFLPFLAVSVLEGSDARAAVKDIAFKGPFASSEPSIEVFMD